MPDTDWNIYNKAVLRNTKNVMKKRVTVWNRQQCQKYASNYSATEELCYGFDHNLNNNCHVIIVHPIAIHLISILFWRY